jgi:hypothetical protein
VPPVAATALGFLAGMVLVPHVLSWLLLARTTFGLHGGDSLGPTRRRLLWTAPIVLLLHPLPYLLVAVILVIGLAARSRLPVTWLWFALGFGLYAVLMGAVILSRLADGKGRRVAPGIHHSRLRAMRVR